jgi:hypothetical protein
MQMWIASSSWRGPEEEAETLLYTAGDLGEIVLAAITASLFTFGDLFSSAIVFLLFERAVVGLYAVFVSCLGGACDNIFILGAHFPHLAKNTPQGFLLR